MRKSNKKGFTLIELLAVIVILGIIMAIAIPSMTQYIANSRKDTMLSTAQEFISAARTMLISENELPGEKKTVVVPVSSLDMNSGGVSPYDNKAFKIAGKSYVVIHNNGTVDGKTSYSYAVALEDKSGNCLATVSEEFLSTSSTRVKREKIGGGTGEDSICASITKLTSVETDGVKTVTAATFALTKASSETANSIPTTNFSATYYE